jgi:hypothetical protein
VSCTARIPASGSGSNHFFAEDAGEVIPQGLALLPEAEPDESKQWRGIRDSPHGGAASVESRRVHLRRGAKRRRRHLEQQLRLGGELRRTVRNP